MDVDKKWVVLMVSAGSAGADSAASESEAATGRDAPGWFAGFGKSWRWGTGRLGVQIFWETAKCVCYTKAAKFTETPF